MTGQDENAMLVQLVGEVRRIMAAGEQLESIMPALVDLFLRP